MVADIKAVRDEITECFSHASFNQGSDLLAKYEALLPEHIKLECEGNRHFYKRELQEAVRCYEAAIGLMPDYLIARYQYLVGIQEEREGKFVDAFKRYQAAIEIEPTFVDSYVELGGLLVKAEDFQGAAQCYRDAVRLDPSDVANHHNLKAVLGKLAQADFDRYGDELAAAEAACDAVAQANTPRELANHRW
jgi:tetratricopeptide (TPR) repeat protein